MLLLEENGSSVQGNLCISFFLLESTLGQSYKLLTLSHDASQETGKHQSPERGDSWRYSPHLASGNDALYICDLSFPWACPFWTCCYLLALLRWVSLLPWVSLTPPAKWAHLWAPFQFGSWIHSKLQSPFARPLICQPFSCSVWGRHSGIPDPPCFRNLKIMPGLENPASLWVSLRSPFLWMRERETQANL